MIAVSASPNSCLDASVAVNTIPFFSEGLNLTEELIEKHGLSRETVEQFRMDAKNRRKYIYGVFVPKDRPTSSKKRSSVSRIEHMRKVYGLDNLPTTTSATSDSEQTGVAGPIVPQKTLVADLSDGIQLWRFESNDLDAMMNDHDLLPEHSARSPTKAWLSPSRVAGALSLWQFDEDPSKKPTATADSEGGGGGEGAVSSADVDRSYTAVWPAQTELTSSAERDISPSGRLWPTHRSLSPSSAAAARVNAMLGIRGSVDVRGSWESGHGSARTSLRAPSPPAGAVRARSPRPSDGVSPRSYAPSNASLSHRPEVGGAPVEDYSEQEVEDLLQWSQRLSFQDFCYNVLLDDL
jgi:hypothetical protein